MNEQRPENAISSLDCVDSYHLSGRYTVRCNRADIAVRVSSYNDIEP